MTVLRRAARAAGGIMGLGVLACAAAKPRKGQAIDRRWRQFSAHRYAHRGLHDIAAGIPENSLPAFRRAREAGYGSELDVHLTADGKVVVIHDSDLMRLTGRPGVVEDLTLEELREYRLQGTDERIPTLEEVLRVHESCGEGEPAPLVVEFKAEGRDQNALCAPTMAILDRHPRLRYVVESFDPRALLWMRRNRPEIIRGQLSENFAISDDATYLSMPVRLALSSLAFNVATRPDFVAYRYEDRNHPGLALCRLMGGRPVFWTIKSLDDALDCEAHAAPIIFEGFTPRPSSTIG